jgi:hypothetical protein
LEFILVEFPPQMKVWILVLLIVIQFSFQSHKSNMEFEGSREVQLIEKIPKKNCSHMKKSKKTVLILSVFTGCFGVDRLYLGFYLMAIAKFLTFGCFGVWYVFDLIFLWLNFTKDSSGCDLIIDF